MLSHLFLGFLAATAPGLRTVEVDASHTAGTIRPFQGVNCGPAAVIPNAPDLSREYRAVQIDIVRTHDLFGPADIDAKWPDPDRIARAMQASADKTIFPNWNADPERPESYHFGPTDRMVQAIVDAGGEVFYRIGRSWAADPSPPPDFDKYTNIVKHVMMHYNAGWANGFHDHIRYWEFWNEPDTQRAWNPQFIRPFWSGTPEQFYVLYEKVARALKALDPLVRVGGPAKALGDVAGPYREGFIAYCAAHRVPLDFYSWHYYFNNSFDSYDLVRVAQEVSRLLKGAGFSHAQNFVTEWNMGSQAERHNAASLMPQAAFMAAALIYLQDSVMERAFYYRGDIGVSSLFNRDGSYRKTGYVFKATASMLDTPERLAAKGSDTFGFAVLAGRSRDGNKVQILIANYEIPSEFRAPRLGGRRLPRQQGLHYGDNQGYALHVTGLPWGAGAFRVTRYRLTEADDFAPTGQPAMHGPDYRVESRLAPPGVELLVLEQ